MTFIEQMLDMWQNIFEGERKFVFFIGFCIVTFAVPFLAIWLSCGLSELYFWMYLRKRYPEIWKKRSLVCKTKGANYYYKCWLKGEIDKDDPFCKITHKHDIFGKVCLVLWAMVVFSVGTIAIVKNYF